MDVIIIKNAPNEGPGNILPFLITHNFRYRIIEAYKGKDINISPDSKYMVVLGGPMGVYEMEKFSYLNTVAKAIDYSLLHDIKVLGICLGAQLFAHVLGSKVYSSGKEEIGWCDLKITEEGVKDLCFKNFQNISNNIKVFQWHGDTFDLPKDSHWLAFSDNFSNQAFKYKGSYALQFHPEVTSEMIRDWFKDRWDYEDINIGTEKYYNSYINRVWLFYEAFFSIMETRLQ
ncbi:MAG TPA: type 1 glutamine amidotransferase [Syntrophorhabdaceae bacterium]|nr:type 1 glutamine amidotransferase [Syntrophorhabdaceae bacterium]